MGKPIFELDFWKERIIGSKKSRDFHSVYLTQDEQWKKIGSVHKDITDKEVKGNVLDAGCGYGRLSEWFSDYIGVDFSPDFISWAKEKYPNKDFIVADLRKLPFEDNSFDWVVCNSIRQMVQANMGNEEWMKMEKELLRVGKKVLILEYTNPEKYTIL